MFFGHLNRRLPFLAFGLFWGAVAGVFHIFNYAVLFSQGRVWQVDWTLIWAGLSDWTLVGPAVGACMIATVLSSAILKRELTGLTWIVNWAITGVVSCVGGVGLFLYCLLLSSFSRLAYSPLPGPIPSKTIEPIVNNSLIASASPGLASADQVPLTMIGPIANIGLIAMIAGITLLIRGLTSIGLFSNWVIGGITLCVGGVGIVFLASCLILAWWNLIAFSPLLDNAGVVPWSAIFASIYFFTYGAPVAGQSAALALLSAPVSLLIRKLTSPSGAATNPTAG